MLRHYQPADQRRIALTYVWVIVCLIVFATVVRGAPPVIVTTAPPNVESEITGKTGEPLFFAVKGEPSKVFMIPGFDKADCPVVRLYSDDENTLSYMAFPKKDGVFYLSFVTQGEKQYSQLIMRIGKGKPNPNPDPEPEPNPQPDPDPINKIDRAWVIVVEDAKAVRSIETAKTLNDPFWASLKANHDYRFYLNSSTVAVENGYVAEAEKTGVGYPAAIIVDTKTNKVIRSFKFTNIDSIKTEFKKVVK